MSNDNQEKVIATIRIRTDRLGLTLMLVLCAVYLGMQDNWYAVLALGVALYYQLSYWNETNLVRRLMYTLREANNTIVELMQALNMLPDDYDYDKDDDHGSDAK